MSNDNKSIPSIDDLISNDLSNKGNDINLDEFSLDTLNLDNLDSLLEKAPEPTKPTSVNSTDTILDIDEIFDPNGGSKIDSTDILDELDALSQAQSDDIAKEPVPSLFGATSATPDELVLPTEDKTPSEFNETITNESATKEELPLAAIAPTPKPTKKSLFGNKPKDKNKSKRAARPPRSGKSNNADSKRLMMIVIGAVIALALLIGVWFLLNNNTNNEMVEQIPVTNPATETLMDDSGSAAIETTGESVPSEGLPSDGTVDTSAIDAAVNGALPEPTTPTADPVTNITTTPSADVPAMNFDTSLIDVNAITQGEIPEDPALIKEEIDRLNDKDGQFAEQAKLIDEQLKMMQDLTKAKEEQIALLEAQIAQLEKEKEAK